MKSEDGSWLKEGPGLGIGGFELTESWTSKIATESKPCIMELNLKGALHG